MVKRAAYFVAAYVCLSDEASKYTIYSMLYASFLICVWLESILLDRLKKISCYKAPEI
jgi:hypothetical protein